MRKILALVLVLLGVVFCAQVIAAPPLTVSNPVNSVMSPVDMDGNASNGYQGYLYVPNTSSPGAAVRSPNIRVYEYNEASRLPEEITTSRIENGELGGVPRGLAMSPDGERLYVAVEGSPNSVKIFNKDGVGVGTIGGAYGAPKGVAVAPDGKRVYVADSTSLGIHVLNAEGASYLSSIPVGANYLYSVAVSPDNTKLAVSRRTSSGGVYLFDINHNPDGTISYSLRHTFTGLYYPSYLVFSQDSQRLFVRVHDESDPYSDLVIFNVHGNSEVARVTLVSPDEVDDNNGYGEALNISPNGEYIYIIHYESADRGKVHAWRMRTIANDLGTPRSAADWVFDAPGYEVFDDEFKSDLPWSKDCVIPSPDGARVWFAYSGGYEIPTYSIWSGFTNTGGVLETSGTDEDGDGYVQSGIPGSPQLNHPSTSPANGDPADDLDDFGGLASWLPPVEDGSSWVYRIDSMEIGEDGLPIGSWSDYDDWHYVSADSVNLSTHLTEGHRYQIRVKARRAYGGVSDPDGPWGSYAYSQVFRLTSAGGDEPVITGLEDPSGDALTEAFVYDTVVITGSGFGADPGDGNRDTATHNVTLGGLVIRDDPPGSTGLEVYSWTDTQIEFGIPRKIGDTFINAGANEIVVTTPSGTSAPIALNIKPRVYAVEPNSCVQGETPSVVVRGTALSGTRNIAFGGSSAGAGTITRPNGDSPDGTGANDEVTVTLPAGLTVGTHAVVATVSSLTSNNDVLFTVNAAGEPNPDRITPNAAPTNSTVAVEIDGSNFAPDAQVELRQGAETISGVVSGPSTPTLINCSFDLTGAALGKWDVVVTNPGSGLSGTIEDGFTVLEEGDVVSTIIDDFEGIAVTYPGDYEPFATGGTITIDMSTVDKYEGARAAELSYAVTSAGFRGYNANLNTEQDLTDYNAISIMVKVDAASTGELKVQLTGRRADGVAANFAPTSDHYIALTDLDWTMHVIPMSALVQIDSAGDEIPGGVDFNDYKARITDYQLVITGNDASAAPVRVDLVRGTGYTPDGNNPPRDFTLASPADGATDVSRLPVFLWNPSVDPDGDTVTYTIVVSENADLSAPVINESGLSDTTYTPSASLAETTTYYWRVTATDGVASTNSETRSFTTGTSEVIENPPGAFELISPADGATGVSRRTPFLWSASIDPDGDSVTYRIVVSENADLSSPAIDESGLSDTNYTPSASLAENTTYYWRVTASDGSLTTDSEIRSFVTGTSEVVNNPPGAFSLISPINGATEVARRTTFRWNASVDPDGDTVTYRIVISENADLSAPVVDESGISGTSYMPASNLDEDTTYYWRVSATDGIAITNSETRSFTTGTLIFDLVDIVSIAPATAYPGQTLVITGTGFGSSAGTITVGGVTSNPTLWTDTEIRTAVPSGVAAGALNLVVVAAEGSDAASVTVNTDGVVIDDVEGGSVGYYTEGLVASGYYSFGTGVLPSDFTADARQVEAAKHGDFGLQVRYSYAGDWGGGFGGQLANTLDLSSENFNTISFYINWDGSSNDLKIAFKDSENHVYASVVSNDILSSLGNYGEIVLSKSSFVEDTDNDTRTEGAIDWSDIVAYEISYPTDGTTGASDYQYIDSISAGNVDWGDDIPPDTGEVQIGGVDPESGPAGTQFTITGDGFGDAQGSSMVMFENKETGTTYPVEVVSWSDDEIVAIVPRLAPEGEYTLKVVRIETTAGTWRAVSSNPIDFEITAKSLNGKAAMIYPNPFNPLATALTASGRAADRATIAYDASGVTNIGIYIYDMTAKQIYHTTTTEGEIAWDGKDNQGNIVADGVYLLRVVNEDSKSLISKGKILVIKRK